MIRINEIIITPNEELNNYKIITDKFSRDLYLEENVFNNLLNDRKLLQRDGNNYSLPGYHLIIVPSKRGAEATYRWGISQNIPTKISNKRELAPIIDFIEGKAENGEHGSLILRENR